MKARLSYEDSCRMLQGVYLDHDSIPPMPTGRPGAKDSGPMGVSFFRTFVGGDLSDLTLPRTFFGRSEIDDAQFRNTDFSESTLSWNDFTSVDFTDAVLARCDLRASAFTDVKFMRADLRGSDMRWSTFENCSFTKALMRDSILTFKQGIELNLSPEQREQIAWTNDQGPEPEGG